MELNIFLLENLKTSYIYFSKLLMVAFIFFIKEKDGSLR